jgi:tetratricopeptide (TPR) repeat protein
MRGSPGLGRRGFRGSAADTQRDDLREANAAWWDGDGEYMGTGRAVPPSERFGGEVSNQDGRAFFVSYTGVNEPWARWICVQLEQAGYSTLLQALDIRPGHDFVHEMQAAVTSATRTIAVLSPAYFESRFGEAEWRVAFEADPSGEHGLLIPVRVQLCTPPGLLATRVYVDLVDLDEPTARDRLLAAVGPPPPRPTTAPFPGVGQAGASGPAGAGAARFPGAGPPVSNLPGRNRHFSGRDVLLTELHARMRAAAVTAVLPQEAVHGLGGVGKTELAIEFGHRFGSDYDIVWWIPAEQPVTTSAALAELAGRLRVPPAADQAATIGALFDLLRGRDRWLLIYDNAEDPVALRGLLPPAGGGSVLVTSRWAAWGRQAEPLRVDVLDRTESVQFLTRRTGLTDVDGLAELAELVGDLPLALDEVAAYLEQTRVGLAEYLALLRDRARDLFGLTPSAHPAYGLAVGGADADQRRVATVWSVSLDRVRATAPAAEALLGLFAFLAPTVPRALAPGYPETLPDALAEVVADPVRYNATLAAAGRYSLIDLDADEVGMHRLVQAVVLSRLSPAEERAGVLSAVGLLRAAFPNSSWEPSSWTVCETLLPHMLVVCEHAQRLSGGGEQTGWLLDRAATYLRERGQYRQAQPLAVRAVALTETALGAQHVDVAWRRAELARVMKELGDFVGARAQYEQILRIAGIAGADEDDIAVWRDGLGSVLKDLGDLDGARTQHERALQLGKAVLRPDHPDVASRHSNLGRVLHDLGDLDGARTQYERALQIGEPALGSDHPDVGIWRNNLGLVLLDLADLDGARTHLERALQIGEAVHGPDHPTVGTRRSNLGGVLLDLGDLNGARAQYERALEITEAARGSDHPQARQIRRHLESGLRPWRAAAP